MQKKLCITCDLINLPIAFICGNILDTHTHTHTIIYQVSSSHGFPTYPPPPAEDPFFLSFNNDILLNTGGGTYTHTHR